MGSKTNGSTGVRGTRYSRSSTVSVAQLFTDSCSSLIQRIASRVRGPSANPESDETPRCLKPNAHSEEEPPVAAARSMRSKGRAERSLGRNSVHSKKKMDEEVSSRWMTDSAYRLTRRALQDAPNHVKSPARDERRPHRRKDDPAPSRRKSATAATRSKHEENVNPLAKSATSVVLAEKAYPYVSQIVSSPREKTPFRRRKSGPSETRPVLVDIPAESDDLSERAAKRKEIQSLVLKYSTWDDQSTTSSTALSKFQQKYSSYLSHPRAPQTVSPARYVLICTSTP
ncbi:hypothetical protein GE061_011843 [Apolygus lucorum]|uniref:Uncharacterized protein n=1 Tax=Apolygus lucorum TaxID=248454 RepID=A0A6A4K7W6_APOLU|nr:hypothetical protein GE061_011843 [Apolygus lucorum]